MDTLSIAKTDNQSAALLRSMHVPGGTEAGSKPALVYLNSAFRDRKVFTNTLRTIFDVHLAQDEAQLKHMLDALLPAAVLIESDASGAERLLLVRKLQVMNAHLPIVMLVSKSDPAEELLSLELGIDGYWHCDTSEDLIAARLSAMLRRAQPEATRADEYQLSCGEITLDLLGRSFFFRNRQIKIAPSEFSLLWLFVKHQGEVMTRDRIFDSLGEFFDAEKKSRVIDVAVCRLRARLRKECDGIDLIKSIRGLGYMLWSDNAVVV
jgi:DNA-binding response OmpR family regulator